MGRSDNGIRAHSVPRSGKPRTDSENFSVWQTPVRHRTFWARFRLFRWPRTVVHPENDSSLSNRLEQGISLFSRMAGPILLVATIVAIIWGISRWIS